jgi:hypothetical protein
VGLIGTIAIMILAAVVIPMAKAQEKEPEFAPPANTLHQFKATLPNSVEVELAALFTGQNKEGLVWWRPDGSLMSEQEYASYEDKIKPQFIRHQDSWELEYGYVLRFTPSDVSVLVDVTVGAQGPYCHPDRDGVSINIVESDDSLRKKGLSRVGDIMVAAACGPFTVKGWNRGGLSTSGVGLSPQSFSLDGGSTIMLTSVRPDRYEPENGLMVDAVVNANDVDMRVLYESIDGKTHRALPHGFGGGPSLVSPIKRPKSMMQYTFRLESVQQADLKRIAVEYRRFRGITFKAVALKPNVKTDVKIRGERPDVKTEEKRELRTVLLPDVDGTGLMLDLASGELVEIPKADTPEAIGAAIEKLDKGDLVFDNSSLMLVRGATSQSLPENSNEPFPVYEIGQRLPEVFVLKTRERVEWTIEIHSVDKNGCRLQYYPVNPNNYVSATPLTALQRGFVEKVLEQVKQVDRKTQGKATHWPHGPMFYHVDSQGRATIWSYQRLWSRGGNDCAQDEVGWGSSQLVHAKGMYYLPDGTALQSRWRWRDSVGGMTNIRVKVGREVTKGERIGLVHRHELPSHRDFYSRDGRERSIVLQAHKNEPWFIIVRVDRPMRLGGQWLGNAQSEVQHLDAHDQLLMSGPPSDDGAPMLVNVELPKAAASASRNDSPATENQKNSATKVEVLRILEKERSRIAAQISSTRQRINQLEQEYGSVKAMEARQEMMLQRVKNLLNKLTEQEAKRIGLETQIEAEYAKNIVQLEREIATLKQSLAPTHPELKEKIAVLEAMKARSKEHKGENDEVVGLRIELEGARAFENRLRAEIDDVDIETVRIGRKMAEVLKMRSQLERAEKMHDIVLSRIKELELEAWQSDSIDR